MQTMHRIQKFPEIAVQIFITMCTAMHQSTLGLKFTLFLTKVCQVSVIIGEAH